MIAGSPDRRIAGSPDRRIAGSPDRRIAGSPDRRIAGSPDRRIAGSPDRRIAGSPDRRIAGSPDRRIAGSPDRASCVFMVPPPRALRETIAILLLGAWLVPMQSHAQTPGVTISSPVAAEGHSTAQPVEGSSDKYNYCARLNAAPSDDVVITATPSPPIVDIDPITFTPGNWSEKQCFNVTPAASADNDIDEPDRVVNISHKVTSSDSNYGNSPSGGQYVVKLRDDDKTLVYVKPANPGPLGPITEGNSDEKIEFVVSLGRPLVAGEIAVAILGIGPWVLGALGEGLKTDDYTMALKSCQGCHLQDADQPYSFVIFSGAGAQSATLEITANDDVISEGAEKISVGSGLQWQYDNLSSRTNVGGGVGPAEPFKVLSTNILDTDGDTPSVRIFPRRRLTVVGEGKPAVLTVQLSEPLDKSAEFTVKTLGGEAEPGVDYESGPWTVTIPAGATSKSFTIRTISDSEYEGSQEWGPELARESFRVWLPLEDLPTGVSAAIPYDHRIHIVDDDVPVIKKPWCVSVELYQTVEGYIRSGQKNGMKQGVAEWTAVRNTFDGQGTFSAAQAREKAKSLSDWKPVAEALECMETPIPDSVLSLSAGSAVYEGENAEFTFTADPAPVAGLTVNVTVAQSGDYLDTPGAGSRTVTFAAGATTATLALATLDDDTDEPDGSVSVTLGSGTGYTAANGQESGSVTVSDDDPWSLISVAGGSAITEGSTARFTLTATPAPQGTLTVNVNIADSGAFASSDATGARQVTIGTTGTATFDVDTDDDDTDEPDGAIGVAIFPGRGYTPSETHGAISIAVSDDDGSTTAVAVAEKDAVPAVCVSDALRTNVESYAEETWRAHPHVERWSQVLAAFGVSNGHSPMTATEAQTYADNGWPRWVPVVTALECLEGAPPPPALPVISIADGTGITEGGDAVFTVSASPAPAAALTVTLTVADDTNSDFLAQSDEGTQTLTIAGGQTSATLTLTTQDDSTDEADGSVTATVTGGSGYTVGTPSTGTVAVSDDDPMPTPVVSIAGGNAITEGGTARFTLTATPAPLGMLTVNVDVVDSGAFAASGEAGAKTVTIDTTGSATLDVATDNDNMDELDGMLGATIASGQGYTPSGTHGSVSIAVRDDDASTACISDALLADVQGYAGESRPNSPDHVPRWRRVLAAFGESNSYDNNPMTASEAQTQADRGLQRWVPVVTALECLAAAPEEQPVTPATPELSLRAGSAVDEGGNATFTVTADPAPATDLTVTWTVAQSGEYLAAPGAGSRTVVLAAGTTSTDLSVATVDDTVDEADGSVSVTLDTGTGYTVATGKGSGTVAVRDNDVTPTTPELSLRAGSAVDEGGHATFTVTADPAPQSDLTIAWTVAQSGEYLAAPGAGSRTMVLAAGDTSTALSVGTVDDDADEADGSVSVTLGTGTGYTIATGQGNAAVAVRDNDEPVVSITAGSGVTEGTSASFTVSASPVPAAPLDITLSVAQSGDFAASGEMGSRTLTVPTSGSMTVEVATVDDGVDEPDGSITATLGTGTGYTVAAAPDHAATVAVSDNDATTPTSGPTISIADATLKENERLGWFTVRLSKATDQDVRFAYATRESTPVSATANRDYSHVPRAWRIGSRIRAGETFTEIRIGIRDDSHDENPETFEVELFDAFMYRSGQKVPVSITDGVAVGTIVNDDPMPAAWLSRFGRTVAEQALDGISGRLSAPRTAGAEGTFGGISLQPRDSGDGDSVHSDQSDPFNSFDPFSPFNPSDPVLHGFGIEGIDTNEGVDGMAPPGIRTMTLQELLLGSHFTATGPGDSSGGSLALWGRAAHSSFDGREGTFSLDGEATTALLGTDYARGKWLVGMALLQSGGEGGYRDTETGSRAASQLCTDADHDMDPQTREVLCGGAVREGDGTVESSLTAAVPYGAIRVSERLKLWGALGYGTGEVTLKPEVGGSLRSDLTWTMASAGLRGDVIALPAQGSGPALAITSDALWSRTESDRTSELAASDSDVTRLRLGLEGSWRIAAEGGGHVTPKVELGLRRDGGDAESGSGVEVGGGIAWVDPGLGLSLDLSGRTLITHEADDLEDRGFAASLAFDPDPASERGLSLALRQEMGGQAEGGLDALFRADPLEDRTGSGETAARWTVEAAYGFPALGGRFTGSPHAGFGFMGDGRDVTVGWRLSRVSSGVPDLSFGVRATRRESMGTAPAHGAGFEMTVRW